MFLLWQLSDSLDTNVLEIMKCVRSVSDCVKSWRAHCILVLLFCTVHRLYWLDPTLMKSLVVLRINLEWRRKLLWSGEEEKEEEEDVTPQIISPLLLRWKTNQTQSDLRTPLTATSGRTIEIF